MKNKKIALIALGMLILGAGGSIALQSFAQTQTTMPNTIASVDSGSEKIGKPHGHAPLGNDGVVTSITGSTIVMTEEADEGGASYTVDATSATVTKDGRVSTLAGITVGDKIFVQGTVNGINVVATSISDGHGGHNHGGFWGHEKGDGKPDQKDANGNDVETNDDGAQGVQTN